MNDERTITAIKNRNEAAINEVITKYSKLLWAVAGAVLNNMGSTQDVEECVADTFIYLWEHPDKYDPQRGKLKTWLSIVARTQAVNRCREISKRNTISLENTDFIDQLGVVDNILEAETRKSLIAAVNALGEPDREILIRRYDDKDGKRQYEWGHYGSDRATLEQDFAARVQEYQRLYNVDVRQVEAPGLYKYYSTQRPVDIGTFPKPPRNAPDEIVNYDQRVPVENGSFLAWGHLTYTRPLTKRQASDYKLRPAPDNPDRPRSIREQMKTAAKQAEADRGQSAPKKNAPDRGDR